MGKKRRLANRAEQKAAATAATDRAGPSPHSAQILGIPAIGVASVVRFGITATLMCAVVVPGDSVAVERGYGIGFSLLALLTLIAAVYRWPQGPRSGRWSEIALVGLLLWLAVSTWATLGSGNGRYALNEFWVWVGLGILFASVRRSIDHPSHKRALMSIVLATLALLSVHAVYQKYVTTPESIRHYEADPDAALRSAQIDAPPGSAMRYQFAGRLYAGESTATFSLSTSASIVFLLGLTISVALLTMPTMGFGKWGTASCVLSASVCAWGGLTTGSRIAAGIAILTLGLLAIARSVRSSDAASKAWTSVMRRVGAGHVASAAVILVTLGVTLVGAAIAGVPSIAHVLPRSMGFRFHYWASSLQMLADHFGLGVGPGNFQSEYAKYKSPTLSEIIADPHNYFLETATSGGILGGVLILATLAMIFRRQRVEDAARAGDAAGPEARPGDAAAAGSKHAAGKRCDEAKCDDQACEHGGTNVAMYAGAVFGSVTTWMAASMFGMAPDMTPYLIGAPLAVLIAWMFSRAPICQTAIDQSALVGSAAVLAALLFSGGISTPGIAAFLWCCLGMASHRGGPARPRTAPVRQAIAALAAFVLLLCFCLGTVNPLVKASALSELARQAYAAGSTQKAHELMAQAAATDPWDVEPARQLSAMLCANLTQPGFLSDHDQPALQNQLRIWESAQSSMIARDPENPRLWQQAGAERLMFFQRSGQRRFLASAREAFDAALQRDPGNAAIVVQMALLSAANNDPTEAQSAWEMARHLDEINDNTESEWDFLKTMPLYQVAPQINVPVEITLKQAWANRTAADGVQQP